MDTLSTESQLLAGPSGANSEPLRVCIQGGPGAFHEIAARQYFGSRPVDIVPALTFEALIAVMEAGQAADIALMAIENTLAGSLMSNYQLLNNTNLVVVGEVYLRIVQNLMALPGQTIGDIIEVYSHPIAIAQCRDFFRRHPHIRLIEAEDTALSARMISDQGRAGAGAIASTLAAEMYDMDLLAESIETNKHNYTRFLVLQRPQDAAIPDDADKVSLSFSVDHEVGSLYKVLAVLAAYQVNLTKIQSAPIIGRPWEYLFFVDFISEGKMSALQALEAIRPLTHSLKIFGRYKKGEHYEL
ncbi:MAG: prephenate dehydratase [Saprospiraceae bacterium]|jgi:prephenate dehydratase|nr:prephenate dehydratase [Saprospiraceae bacterium]